MYERMGIIADDLTGAGDSACQFASCGIQSVVVLDEQSLPDNIRVIAVDADTRGIDEKEAAFKVLKTAAYFRKLGISHYYKKIDSLLRGNVVTELEVLINELGATVALVAPAYPANFRITAGGFHLVKQVPIAESEASQDPVTPVCQSHLPSLFTERGHLKVGNLDLGIIHQGAAAIRWKIEQMIAEGVRVIVCDATTEAHLELLARLLWEHSQWLGCGSAGLARALALQKKNPTFLPTAVASFDNTQPVLMLAGTRSSATLTQIEECRANASLVPIQIERLLGSDSQVELKQLSDRVSLSLINGKDTIVYLPFDAPVIPGKETSRLLAEALGKMVAIVLAEGRLPAGLLLTGGDTAKAVCRHLKVHAIEVFDELCPAVPVGSLVGGDYPTMKVVTKGGSCGTADILLMAIEYLKGRMIS